MLLTLPPVVSLSALIYCNPGFTLYLLRSGPLPNPEELQEPYADRTIKASDKCGRKSKTTHSVEAKPVKLLHFSHYASRYFHEFCSTMGEFTECSEAIFVAKFGASHV
ncbi:hypothetical protein CHARACLAT_015848 [Characodon lateralis]|uniref:Secreted protein n=1 Tax=Characodon lateralis TaxID=208331 RepID=A0ABU7CP07_9TELE|nr:hypothetical protein [Characodon lateralis]